MIPKRILDSQTCPVGARSQLFHWQSRFQWRALEHQGPSLAKFLGSTETFQVWEGVLVDTVTGNHEKDQERIPVSAGVSPHG